MVFRDILSQLICHTFDEKSNVQNLNTYTLTYYINILWCLKLHIDYKKKTITTAKQSTRFFSWTEQSLILDIMTIALQTPRKC